MVDIGECDASKYLDDKETAIEHLNAATQAEDPRRLQTTIGDVAKARGMARADCAKDVVLKVFKNVDDLAPFPVAWRFAAEDSGSDASREPSPVEWMFGGDAGVRMSGTLHVDGRDFSFSCSFRRPPTMAVAAHVLGGCVSAVASELLDSVDVRDLWPSEDDARILFARSHGVCGFSEAVNGAATHVADVVRSDMEAYANLLTVAHALEELEGQYRTGRV